MQRTIVSGLFGGYLLIIICLVDAVDCTLIPFLALAMSAAVASTTICLFDAGAIFRITLFSIMTYCAQAWFRLHYNPVYLSHCYPLL